MLNPKSTIPWLLWARHYAVGAWTAVEMPSLRGRHDVFALEQVVLIIFCEGTQSPFVLKAHAIYDTWRACYLSQKRDC